MSEKHAGFVINRENASPEEIRDLIEAVRTRVFETSGVPAGAGGEASGLRAVRLGRHRFRRFKKE